MEVAGMNVVLGANYEGLKRGFDEATRLIKKFETDTIAIAKTVIAPSINLDKLNDYGTALSKMQDKAISLTIGTDGLNKLSDIGKQLEAIQGKVINVTANTEGLDNVLLLKKSVDDLHGKGIFVSVAANGIDQIADIKKQIESIPDKTVNIAVTSDGIDRIAQLNTAIKELQGKSIKLSIAADGAKVATLLRDSIKDLQSRTIKIITEVTGIDQLLQAGEAAKELQSKTVNISASVRGETKIVQLNAAIKALKETGGIVLDVKATDSTQLLTTLRQIQALGTGKTSLQVVASGKGLAGLNTQLKNAAAYASLAESSLKSLETAANTSMQALASQNTEIASYLASIGIIAAQATQQAAQLTQAVQNTATATDATTSTVAGLAGAADAAANAAGQTASAANQASAAAQTMNEAFKASDAAVNTFVLGNVDLTKSIEDNVQILNQYRARMSDVSAQISALAKMEGLSGEQAALNQRTINTLGAEYAQLKQQVSQATSVINAQSKATITAEDSYNGLQQRLTLVNKAIRDLSGADLSSALGTGLIKQSAELQKALVDIDAQMGIHVRNVGNYSSATNYLNQTMAQLTGEIPNFFQSMKVGFMSISNNIQPIIFALQSLRKENAALAASGQPTSSAFKAILSSLLSWQTALFVGVGIISQYGGEIVKWIGDVSNGKTELDKLRDAIDSHTISMQSNKSIIDESAKSIDGLNKKYKDSIGEANGHAAAIMGVIAQLDASNNSRQTETALLSDVIKQYPQIIELLDGQALSASNLANIYNTKLLPAIIAKARLEANKSLLVDLFKEQAKAALDLADAQKNVILTGALLNNTRNSLAHVFDRTTVGTIESFTSALRQVPSAINDYIKRQLALTSNSADYEKALSRVSILTGVYNIAQDKINQTLSIVTKSQEDMNNTILSSVSYYDDLNNKLNVHVALQKQFKPGTEGFEKEAVIITQLNEQLQAYGNTHKAAKQHVDALTKSQNTLQAALKEIDAELQSGQITSLEAARQKMQAYRKDLDALFLHGGKQEKIDIDLTQIGKAQDEIKKITTSDTIKQFQDALKFNAQLNAAGLIDPIEETKRNLDVAKKTLESLATGKDSIPLDDERVINAQNEVKKLQMQLDNLTKEQKIKLIIDDSNKSALDISNDLKNGWITPLEATQEQAKRLETEIKNLQKAGASSSMIIPVKIELTKAKQDAAVQEVNDILKETSNKFEGTNITIKQAVDLQLISDDEAIQQSIRNMNNHLRGLYQSLGKVDINSDLGRNIQRQIVDTLKDIDITKQTEDLNKRLRSQMVDGLAGIGESIGNAIAGNGGMNGIFDGMMQSLGDQLETLGKWMIETAIKFAIIKETFTKALQVNPLLGVVAGIATVALGSAIKNAFQNKQKQMKFADGGIVYGRTNAIIGEYQGAHSNPEVVAPLNKLKSILQLEGGGGTQKVEVVGMIDNDVIRLASERSSIKSKR